MNHFSFVQKDTYKICFLVNKIKVDEISREYLKQLNVKKEDILLLDLYKNPKKKKTSVSEMKEYLRDVEEVLQNFEVDYVVVCNSDYYKTFSKESKADVNIGYVKEVGRYKVVYLPDYHGIFYDPDRTRDKIQRSIQAINDHLKGSYVAPGEMIFSGYYPKTQEEIYNALNALLNEPSLTCDIEAFSLKPHKAGIASIAFAPSIHKGVAFQVDPSFDDPNYSVRGLLQQFFHRYQGTLIFHNIAYDATVLIYQLYMEDITDTHGLLNGMSDLLKNFEDTKLIAYLATNSCAGNELGLKTLAQEFAGNWAQEEIGDVSKIAQDQLLEYNLKDCLATWFVYMKYRQQLITDEQEDIYNNLFLPSTKNIIQMQLTGFPLNMKRVLEVEQILQKDLDDALKTIQDCPYTKYFVQALKEEWVVERNNTLKKKRVTIEDAKIEFNPRSHLQLQKFLFEDLGLPVLNTTASGLPATDSATMQSLLNRTEDEETKKLLQAFIDFSAVDKILTAFIPAFKEAVYSPRDKWHYLIGSFNLGGTVSGRLSSSNPNLQNLPATGSKYAKVIKSCFQPPQGWLLCGLDFNALEDHISALLTKDTNKLKVYIDHYDGHCLRAYSYFKEKMPDITAELDEIKKEGRVFKVTLDSGEVRYYNEFNPEFIELRSSYANHERHGQDH